MSVNKRMRTILRAIVVVLSLTLAAIALPVAARAAGSGDPVISAPASNGAVPDGWAGPIKIDFSNAPTDTYDAEVRCSNFSVDRFHTMHYRNDGDDRQIWTMQSGISGPKKCHVDLYGEATDAGATIAFSVNAPPVPPLTLKDVSVSQPTFYPMVRDGYKDRATVSYRINRHATVTVKVYNADGHVERRAPLGGRSAGPHEWAWNGRRADGTKVNTGKFRIQITAAADRVRSANRWVTVASGWRHRSVSNFRSGYDTVSTSHTSLCYVDFDHYEGTTDLDCWGGAYAQANYHFKLPTKVHDLSWSVRGYRNCCSNGTTSKWGMRTGSTSYRVSVKVTDWHSYTVTGIRLSYTYKVRI